ncbi:DMT family transporter [Cryobacterium sp. BB736]|uniref:DMT family transporter n=1 Tax=Cryobacterium sp. BB736 TaxID=2746963 RepID=UPI00351C20DA
MTSTMKRDAAPTPASGVTPLVLVAIIVTVLAWASAFIVIRGVAPHFSGGGLALGRLVVGTVLLALLLIGKRWVKPTGREWVLILVFGIAWFGLYNVALNIAEQTLDAGTSAMIVNIAPILIALGAGVFLGERVPKWLIVGTGVAFFGVILIGIASGASLGGGAGIWWCLLAAVTYSIGVLCQKPVLKSLPASQVTWMGAAIGTIACLPFTGNLISEVQAAPIEAVLGVVYLGAVPTALAFSTWAYALGRMPASQLGVTTYVVPALVILLGWLVFSEIPAPLAIVGGALCLVGVAVSRMRPRRPESTPVPASAGNLSE